MCICLRFTWKKSVLLWKENISYVKWKKWENTAFTLVSFNTPFLNLQYLVKQLALVSPSSLFFLNSRCSLSKTCLLSGDLSLIIQQLLSPWQHFLAPIGGGREKWKGEKNIAVFSFHISFLIAASSRDSLCKELVKEKWFSE